VTLGYSKKIMKQATLSSSKKKAWKQFSLYIRSRNSLDGETAQCITCLRWYPIKELQAGHWLPGRHNSVLFDERNCHEQCYGCNVMKKGNPVVYYHFMETKYGKEVMEELESKDRELSKLRIYDFQELEKKYKDKLDKLDKLM